MYSIASNSIKYLETRNGVAFTADLLLDGKKLGTVENDGNGGATSAYKSGGGYMPKLGESELDAMMDNAEGV